MPKSKFRINSKSVLVTWLLSYAVVLLFPILISIVVYFQSSRMLENEIHEANDSLLEQFRSVMDGRFADMKRLSFELGWNLKVRQLLYSNKYLNYPNDFYYDLYQITQDLNVYKTSFPQIDLFYIYLAKEKLMLLPNLYREAAFGYQLLHADQALPFESWKWLVESGGSPGFIPSVRITEDGVPTKTVAYVAAHPYDNGLPVGTNIVMIDRSRIIGAVDKMELFNKGHVAIYNEKNELLVSSLDESMLAGLPLAGMTGDKPTFWQDGERRFEVSVIRSADTNLKYVTLIPSGIFWEKAQQVRAFTYLSIAVSILGGGILTYVFARRQYNPVRSIVQSLAAKPEEPKRNERGYNEFRFIQEALVSTLGEIDRLRRSVKQQHSIVRAHFIARLLQGRTDAHIPVSESLAAFDMRFESDDFAVMLLYADESEFTDGLPGEHPDKLKLLHFIVTNVTEELASARHRGYVAEVGGSLACLINFASANPEQRRRELQWIAREVRSFMKAKFRVRLSVSLSSIHRTLRGIPQAYTEALDAMEYKLVMGDSEILSYDDIVNSAASDSDEGYYYPLEVEQQLINCVKAGHFPNAERLLGELIARNFESHVLPAPVARCLVFDLLGTLIKCVSEMGGGADLQLFQRAKRIERLTACETIADMRGQMTDLLQAVCEYTGEKRRRHMEESRSHAYRELAARVSAFIADRYDDPNLNITMIGAHFGLKPAYISKLYKEQTGEGLLDRINRERVSQAKRVIGSGNKSVSDVAGRVGFHDVNAFIRIFKKVEGVTPGAYKESLLPKA
ncbi:helix-turn-helix domain-containing protein [Paenibacillus sp. GYB003]|uniref:helix-turn-helix domain-containing protein n=1 Tax=Paenibacillus sp. GYB003 TaxID=2994392 RepID=UPI002F96D663